MLFGKKDKKTEDQQQPKVMQINLVDVVKQASVQIKYEEIGSWLSTHKTPLFWCHERGFSIVDKNFIEDRPWLKKALGRMVKEIEEQKAQKQQQVQQAQQQVHSQILQQEEKDDKTPAEHGYIG